MKKKKILLLTTGGTIASQHTEGGLAPTITGEGLRAFVGSMLDAFDVTVRDILHLDSSNMQPEEWEFIAKNVYENRRAFDGIVITHGTDTMSYTAAALSFMLQGIPIPVVLTGAQLPITHPLSDATDNLRTAFAMAAAGYGGVYLAFDRRVILGTRAVKTHTMDFGAFDSVNAPFAAEVNAHGLVVNEAVLPGCDPHFPLQDGPVPGRVSAQAGARRGPAHFRCAAAPGHPGHRHRGLRRRRRAVHPPGSDGQAARGHPQRRQRGGVLPVPV